MTAEVTGAIVFRATSHQQSRPMTHDTFAIIKDTDPVAGRLRGGVVAIGNFDGVHRGHQAVLSRVIAMAKQRGAPALALTFEPHPRPFFRPPLIHL